MRRPRLPVRPTAVLLALILTCTSPFITVAFSVGNERALALANADATKAKALSRLDTEASHISQNDQARFTARMTAAIAAELATLRGVYNGASTHLAANIGYGDPWLASWKRFWNSPEEAQRVFQDKIDAALVQAGVPVRREKAAAAIDSALLDAATAEYQAYRHTFNTILYETISTSGGLGVLTKDLVRDLIARIDTTSQQFAMKEGVIDAHVATGSPSSTVAMLSTILVARVTQSVLHTAGARWAAQGALSTVLGALTGPVGWALLGVSAIYDVWNAKATAFEASNKTLRQSYDDFAAAYTAPQFMQDMTRAVVAGLEQQLEADRQAARTEMDRYFRGILVQAKSPGFAAFVQGRDEREASKGLQHVSAAFGDDFMDVPLTLKYELVHDIGVQKAGALLQAHGPAFVDLYRRERLGVTAIMRNPRYAEIMMDVFSTEQPSVAFYKQGLDRFGSLDAPQTDALILIHTLHPTKKADEINKDALTVIGPFTSRLAAIKTQNPQAAATTVDWVLNGQMSGTLMSKLVAHAHAATLLALPLSLGPDIVTRMLGVVDETIILKFLSDFTAPGESNARVMALLREDATGHLKSYSTSPGGGPKAVLARHTLLQEYGGTIPATTDRTLHWLLAHTPLEYDHIHKTTIENLHALGIPDGRMPLFIAIPAARLVSMTGLLGPIVIIVALIGIGGLALARGAFWVALPFPLRRRRIEERPVLNVTHVPKQSEEAYRNEATT